MSDTNCPNCGAPIDGIKCRYCGTQFFNIADIDFTKPRYIRIPIGNRDYMFNVIAEEIGLSQTADDICEYAYADNIPYLKTSATACTLNIKLRVVPDDDGVMMLFKENV